VTCNTQSCKPCKVTCILQYLPQGGESSPRGRWGICGPALLEVLTVHTKLTVKTIKRRQGAVKLSDKVCNALAWYGLERHLQNQSIEPKIENLRNTFFAEGTSTSLKTLMIKVKENKSTTPVTKKFTKKHFFDEQSLESGVLMKQELTLLTYRTDLKDRSRSYVT
jgi:hypothetical protein